MAVAEYIGSNEQHGWAMDGACPSSCPPFTDRGSPGPVSYTAPPAATWLPALLLSPFHLPTHAIPSHTACTQLPVGN